MQPPSNTPKRRATRSQAAENHLLDFGYIDTQYANQDGKYDPEGYGKEPWRFMDGIRYQGDIANAFLSIRFGKRAEFLANLNEEDREKVHYEITRIAKTRARFETYEDKKAMLEALQKARTEWKHEVVETLSARKVVAEGYTKPEKQERYTALLARMNSQHYNTPVALPEGGNGPELLGPDCGFKAGAMYFQLQPDSDGASWEGCDSNHTWFGRSTFPNQKIAVDKLLEKHEDNPLTKRENNRLRWFHFPTNHMGWIEKAIARYYGEDNAVHDRHVKPHPKTTQAEKLLCREAWHGQFCGSSNKDPIHARHMRPGLFLTPRESPAVIEAPTQDTEGKNPSPPPPNPTIPGIHQKDMKNMALFIPYLHWETDSNRAKMADAIDNAYGSPSARKKKIMTDFAAVYKQINLSKSQDIKHSRDGASSGKSKLGEYLMQLARVAEAMDNEMDEQLLMQDLRSSPPLHVRRTLDQYYFFTLNDTSARDRDQVVYRKTLDSRGSCGRNARVVMVDQLWLWILDDDTIITSFPRRWGKNKPDPSEVHTCLKERLANNRISSIYHLALIIIDQCSGVFFDRTKPLDQRPEVIDLFGSAIGYFTELSAIAYDTFWRNTSLHQKNFLLSGTGPTSSSGQHRKIRNAIQRCLSINPEMTLLREGRDIAEELNIMHRVFSQQWQAVRDFQRHLGQLLVCKETDDRRRRDTMSQYPSLPTAAIYAPAATASSTVGGSSSSTLHRESTRFGDSSGSMDSRLKDTLREADMLLESIESRQAEIQDLEDLALRTCRQLEGLLSLKQQQASIVDANAALTRRARVWEFWDEREARPEERNSASLDRVSRRRADEGRRKDRKRTGSQERRTAADAKPSAADREHEDTTDARSVRSIDGSSTLTGRPATSDADVGGGRRSKHGLFVGVWDKFRPRNGKKVDIGKDNGKV